MKSTKFVGAGYNLIWYIEKMKNPKDRNKLMKCIYCGHYFAHDSAHDSGMIHIKLSDISCINNSESCTDLYNKERESK